MQSGPDLQIYATGWRATANMVVTYVHTGGTNTTGSDRKKRRYIQLSDGNIWTDAYSVKRPKVSAEYQSKMGAIDSHNFRRQSCRGTKALEKVCVTRNAKDRVFINIVGWVLTNIYLAKKHFEWNGEEKMSSQEVQEAVALALINNQWSAEDINGDTGEASPDATTVNDPDKCVKHPHGYANRCKYCYRHKTWYICLGCSNPASSKIRRDKARVNRSVSKVSRPGYWHFCKGECYKRHNCGNVPWRRPKATSNDCDEL